MTFGPLMMKLDDLEEVDALRFIGPEDMARLKAPVPIRGGCCQPSSFPYEGLQVFPRVSGTVSITRFNSTTASCTRLSNGCYFGVAPARRPVDMGSTEMPARMWRDEHSFRSGGPSIQGCPGCGQRVYLADALRLLRAHRRSTRAGGVMSYLLTTFEHLAIVHLVRSLWGMSRPS